MIGAMFRHGLRRVKVGTRGAWRWTAALCTYWIAAGDTRSLICETIEGDAPLGRRVCIFVHYDRRGRVSNVTRRYLSALRAEGFSIIVVSNSRRLDTSGLAYLRRLCVRVLMRRNRGYDFGGYRDGILWIGDRLACLDVLLIANDSVYGPITPLGPLFGKMNFESADVWGATDSWQHRYHLQSYLICFGPAALKHKAFLDFWRGVRNARSKWAAVYYCEVAMAAAMLSGGLRCSAVYDYTELSGVARTLIQADEFWNVGTLHPSVRSAAELAIGAASCRSPLNPSIDLWALLIEAGFPFLKRELLRDDPISSPDRYAWHYSVSGRSSALHAEIIEDLKLSLRRSAP